MLTIEFLKRALLFLFGTPHNVMYSAAAFVGVNLVLDFFRRYEPPKRIKQILHEFLKRLLAYMAFIVIAARIDAHDVSAMFGWEGSTQLPVCLYIMAREIRVIFSFIREQGIDVPITLDNRVEQMKRSEPENNDFYTKSMNSYVEAEDIDRKIQGIKLQLSEVEKLRNTSNNDSHNGGELT